MNSSCLKALSPLGLACAAVLIGCGGNDTTPERGGAVTRAASPLSVVAAFYPLEEAARGVGGDLVTVTNLTDPGQGPHDLQLEPRQLEVFDDADITVYLGRGFQPQVEQAIANAPKAMIRLDLLDTVGLLPVDDQLEGTTGEVDGEVLDGDVDPHVWLDPTRMIAMVDAITEAFVDLDPGHERDFRVNAASYLTSLRGLDAEYRSALATCRSRVIVTSHRAFGYLSDRYDLRQIPIAGISPEIEPDPRTLEAIADEAEAEGVTTIFLESIAPADLAETVANEIGADLDLLDPIEGLSTQQLAERESYATIMRDNLIRLVSGLGCTK
jgi:zinc transport system substrate-binding protein